MKKITPITDDELKFEIELEEGPIHEYATDVLILWDDCLKGEALPLRYEAFRTALATRWGKPVSRGTAFLVLDAAVAIVGQLKKTHSLVPSLKSLVSKQEDELPPS